MPRIVIVYASNHHGNTRKLVEAISEDQNITLIDAAAEPYADLEGFDLIGFASGIDFGCFYDCVVQFLKNNLPEKKKVFFLFTCAKVSERFISRIREEAAKKKAECLGAYGCRGYNTYGPWKLVGGMNRNHPNAAEIAEGRRFLQSLCE